MIEFSYYNSILKILYNFYFILLLFINVNKILTSFIYVIFDIILCKSKYKLLIKYI